MWFGLWRYWLCAKGELVIIAILFGIVVHTLSVLLSLVVPKIMTELDVNRHSSVFAFGEPSDSGYLSPTNLKTAKLVKQISSVEGYASWYVDTLDLSIGDRVRSYRVAFVTPEYQRILPVRLTSGKHPLACSLSQCELQGVIIGQALHKKLAESGSPDHIEISGRSFDVNGVAAQRAIDFPRSGEADIVIDISYFGSMSSFTPMLESMLSFAPDTTTVQQIISYIPVFSTAVMLKDSNQNSEIVNELAQLHQVQIIGDASPIASMINLSGARKAPPSLIQGLYFSEKSKHADLITTVLVLIACVILFFTILLNLLSIVARHAIRRAAERSLRHALGSSRMSVFWNEFLFIMPPFLLGFLVFLILLELFMAHYVAFAHTLFTSLTISDGQTVDVYFFIGGFLAVVPAFMSASSSAKLIGKQKVSRLVPRHTVRNNRFVTIIQYALGITIIGLSGLVLANWLILKSTNGQIDSDTHLVKMTQTANDIIDTQWNATWNATLGTHVSRGIALMKTPPGDRNLKSLDIKALDIRGCIGEIRAWKNKYLGQPFKVLKAEPIAGSVVGMSQGDIAISLSLARTCHLSAVDAIGKMFTDTDGNQYKVKAVVPNIEYDLRSKSPEMVIYEEQQQPGTLYNVILDKSLDIETETQSMIDYISDNRIQLAIEFSGSLNDHFNNSLIREQGLLKLTLWICIITLAVLVFGFVQHNARVLVMRKNEWGVRKALGASVSKLQLTIIRELVVDWGISLFVVMCFLSMFLSELFRLFPSLGPFQLCITFFLAGIGVLAGGLLCSTRATFILVKPADNLLRDEG